MNRFIRILAAFLFVVSTSLNTAYAGDVKEFTVLTRGTTKPIAYFDDNDKLTGFDIELLREIEKRNPSIRFVYKTMSISAAFVALDSRQGDLIAHQMAKNPQRAEKYLFSAEVNNYTSTRLAVREDNHVITGLDDLRGKKVITTATSEFTRFLQEYNSNHGKEIEILYTDKGADESFNALVTGRADAASAYEYLIKSARDELGLKIKLVGAVILSDPTFFILRKSPETEELVTVIDTTLKELRADGTLAALSEKFFGADYTFPQQ